MKRNSALASLLLIAVAVTLFAGTAYIAFGQHANYENRGRIADLNAQALRRAELAIDYAFIALGELAEEGHVTCSDASIVALRGKVHQRSLVKDIRIVDASGSVLCSAFPDAQAEVSQHAWERRATGLNANVQVLPVNHMAGAAMGVVWQIDPERALIAVANADALLYDILPERLRDPSEVLLCLNDGRPIARYATDAPSAGVPFLSFWATSARYPVMTSLKVDPLLFARWNHELKPFAAGVGGLLGLVFGFLLRGIMIRPPNPVAEIDRGLGRHEFRPYFQPIFSLDSMEIVGCEVLARWLREDGSIHSPAQFIPIAESSGRIAQLTRQLTAEALACLQPWLRQHKSFKVGVNICAAHLLSDGFVDDMRSLVLAAKVSPRQIMIELTERQAVEDIASAATVTASLREFGFKIAVDDAGTGHNGLSQIQALGVQVIKIDKFFVDAIERDAAATAVVGLLVGLARELGMTTVAEGIETEAQIAALRRCGVDEGQGYVVSRPLSGQAFLALLEAWRPAVRPAPRLAVAG